MAKIIAPALPALPWQPKSEHEAMPVWRYSANPIIGRHDTPISNSIFNSAVVPFQDGFAGVFRCDSKAVSMDIYPGFSKDGIHWDISSQPVVFEGDPEVTVREYRYDPRV
ncbi:MAG: glycosidase, partial [Oscillospiraceae bacterium]|nr:glycosidase [Oscillospiraceae bacterium]